MPDELMIHVQIEDLMALDNRKKIKSTEIITAAEASAQMAEQYLEEIRQYAYTGLEVTNEMLIFTEEE